MHLGFWYDILKMRGWSCANSGADLRLWPGAGVGMGGDTYAGKREMGWVSIAEIAALH